MGSLRPGEALSTSAGPCHCFDNDSASTSHAPPPSQLDRSSQAYRPPWIGVCRMAR